MPATTRTPGTPSRTIFIVGALNADTTLEVPHHPRPGETITATARRHGVGGKGANQAIAASLAGATVSMIGAVGADAEGDAIASSLADAGVETSHLQRAGEQSGSATVIVDAAGENSIVISPGANATVMHDTIDDALKQIVPGDIVVLQNEIAPAATAHAAAVAASAGAQVIWNAAPAPALRAEIPPTFDVLVVNEGELTAIGSLIDVVGRDVTALIEAVAHMLDVDVVCTRGPDGVSARIAGETLDVPALRVRAIDTTGAGDTFVGYFAAGAGLPAATRLHRAAVAGSVAVTRPGAAASIPDRSAVDALLPV